MPDVQLIGGVSRVLGDKPTERPTCPCAGEAHMCKNARPTSARKGSTLWHATSMDVTRVVGLNKLYYGDNLDVLREHIVNESADLI